MTDNERIAKFMGFIKLDGERYYSVPASYKNLTYNEDFIEDIRTQLFFNDSWDWLMPVVEKINETGVWTIRPGFATVQNPEGELRPEHKFKFIKSDLDFEEVNDNLVDWIVVVHAVVVEFIKWFETRGAE